MASYKARSISLPSRSHPEIPQIQELLCKLRPVEITSLSLSAISSKLIGLGHLFEVFDKFLLLPRTQQAFFRGCNEKWADELPDGLVLLVDVCGIAKDVLSQSKEHIQELQSMFRRRWADEFKLAKKVGDYSACRKKAKKVIHKVLKDSKTSKCGCWSSTMDKGDDTIVHGRHVKTDSRSYSHNTQIFAVHISGFKTQSRVSRWTLVSNLMRSKHVGIVEEAIERNEFEKVDAALHILLDHKAKKSSNLRVENLQINLGKLELSVEDLE